MDHFFLLISRPPTIIPIFFILINDRIYFEAGAGGEEGGTCPAASLLCPCCELYNSPANLCCELYNPPANLTPAPRNCI